MFAYPIGRQINRRLTSDRPHEFIHIFQFFPELSQKGLVFHPPCHIGDEWFVPVGIPAIFIPFFLVHDRLRQLERRRMLDVEGETPESLN